MVTAQPAPAYAIVPGNCLEIMRTLGDNSVDAIVTDPPYGLSNTDPAHVIDALTHWLAGDRAYVPEVGGGGFMGKAWDKFVPPPSVWDECLRVLKPGGHLLSFAGTRTIGLMEMSIRLAGFDIRDSIAWLYGSGFPKSLDVSKAIDKMDATDARRSRALRFTEWMRSTGITSRQIDEATGTNMGGHYLTASSQPAVATLAHLDTLRPLLPSVPRWVEEMAQERTVESQNYAARAVVGIENRYNEPSGIVNVGQGERVAIERKITEAHTPEAEQWQGWGTALKPAFEPVVVGRKPFKGNVSSNVLAYGTGALNIDACRIEGGKRSPGFTGTLGTVERSGSLSGVKTPRANVDETQGRWPANVILDESQAAALDEQSGRLTSGGGIRRNKASDSIGTFKTQDRVTSGGGDSGGASRFFYCAKAPKKERPVSDDGTAHPTVKPLALMRWLVRLVTPPGGVVLDPFAGSGPTLEAALLEGFTPVAIELGGPEGTPEHHYPAMIQQRADRALAEIAARPTPETAQEEESIPA